MRTLPRGELSSLGCVASYWRLGSVARWGLGALTPMLASCANVGAKARVSAATVAKTARRFMDELRQHRKCQPGWDRGGLEKRGVAAQVLTSMRGGDSIWNKG